MLEKIYVSRLNLFLLNNSIINKCQYGFKKRSATVDALHDLTENIFSSLDEKQFCMGIFIDLRKAFDTVDHEILVEKLEFYGLRGTSGNFLRSYLSNRSQYVRINDTDSDVLYVKCGVPQGSVIGPILFNLYINDMMNSTEKLKFVLFADDTNLFYSGRYDDNTNEIINTELNKLYEWLCTNKGSINREKTNNYIIFKTRQRTYNTN